MMPAITKFMLVLFCLIAVHTVSDANTYANDAGDATINDTGQHKYSVPFFSVLTDAINKATAAKYKTQVTLIAYPSQGDLMWYYQNNNGIFNQGTFDYVSARVAKGKVMPYTAELSSSGGFSNAYSSVITSLYYNLSTADIQQLSNVTMAAQIEAMLMVSAYEIAFGNITADQLDSAIDEYGNWITGKPDYVVDVVAGGRWSGKQKAGLAPLSYTQMAYTANLDSLLPDTPAGAAATIQNLRIYLDKIKSITRLADSASNGAWTIAQIRNNTTGPSAANGGMKTVNPNTGEVSSNYQVGYNIPNSIPNIYNDLNNVNRSITILMHLKKTGTVHIDIYTAWDKNKIDTISYNLPDSVSINMYPLSSGQSDQMIEVVYYGFTMINTGPTPWSSNANTGWYFSYPIDQAIANDTQDVTGYQFAVWPPPYNMAPYDQGGDFGFITHLLICNYQKLAITMGFTGNASPTGVKPSKSSPGLPVPTMLQTAYVVGGSFAFPQSEKK